MRALDEAGVPVDAIGGTSIGAVMGAFRALDLDADTRERWALSGFVESGNLFPPTFPILSYSSARKVRQLLESDRYLGDRTVEETWIPFFCVSANLTRAEVVVHERGPLATAVRPASRYLASSRPSAPALTSWLTEGSSTTCPSTSCGTTSEPVRSWPWTLPSKRRSVQRPPTWRRPQGGPCCSKRLAKHQDVGAMPLSLNVLMRARELAGIRAQRQILAEWPPDLLIRPDGRQDQHVRLQGGTPPHRCRSPGCPGRAGGRRLVADPPGRHHPPLATARTNRPKLAPEARTRAEGDRPQPARC